MNKINKSQVNVEMLQETQLKVDSIQKLLHATTKSDVIKTSVDITSLIASTLANQGEVIIKDKDGIEKRIVMPGITG